MLVLITYDVGVSDPGGKARLRKIAKACVNYGQRVQNSVFECSLDPCQLAVLKDKLARIMDPSRDSIRFYNLGKNYKSRVEHVGIKQSYMPDDVLIV